MKNKKPFTGFHHGNKPMNLTHLGRNSIQMLPTEIHCNSNGSLKDEPSFAIVLQLGATISVFGQISLEMWSEGLADIGYKIVKV